jgi:hypothetical protein
VAGGGGAGGCQRQEERRDHGGDEQRQATDFTAQNAPLGTQIAHPFGIGACGPWTTGTVTVPAARGIDDLTSNHYRSR